MNITDEMVDRLAYLARLELPEGERETTRRELERILGYMTALNALDDGAQEARSGPVNVLRGDEVRPSMSREELLELAPAHDDETILVPRTVE